MQVYETPVEDEDDGARRSADAPWPRRQGRGRIRRRPPRRSRGWSTNSRSAISRRSPAASSRPCRSRRSRPARTASSWSSDAPSGCSAPSATRRRVPVFEALRQAARDDDRELVQLRLAECDYFLKRRAQRARRRRSRTSTRARGRAKRCSSTRSPRASSAATTNTSASSGGLSRSFRRRAGRKKR